MKALWAVRVPLCFTILGVIAAAIVIVHSSDTWLKSPQGSRQQLQVDDASVFVVNDFFDAEQAQRWREELFAEWKLLNASAGKSAADKEDRLAWKFATNNNGIDYGGNAKFRSLRKIRARKALAHNMRRKGRFSYAKWELRPSHHVIAEIRAQMLSLETRRRIANVLDLSAERIDGEELSDLFVTNFAPGSFLSKHSDGNSGTYAFVVSLAHATDGGWREGYGGELAFYCQGQRSPCEVLRPTFNQLILFKTRAPPGPLHAVLPVKKSANRGGFFRFGITGWYADVELPMSAAERHQRDQMRGIDL